MKTKPLLWGLFILQAVCAGFFVIDAFGKFAGLQFGEDSPFEDVVETLITVMLAASLAFTGRMLRRMMRRQERIEDQLRIASGAFAALLDERFAELRLTPSERDVALLALKGFSNAEMAELRETREGAIKAQCNAVYRKAGVNGRPQLLGLFIEELMAEPLSPQAV